MNIIPNPMLSLDSSINATQRVHDVPELRHLILTNADAATFQALSHATPDFFASAHTPLAWAKQYGPAEIDMHSRSIRTSYNPNSKGNLSELFRPHHGTLPTRELGTYRGEPWTLKIGLDNSTIRSNKAQEIIDSVTTMKFTGFYCLQGGESQEEGFARLLQERRPETYGLMRDRAYRLEHGIRVPFDGQSIGFVAITGAFIGLTYVGYLGVFHLLSAPGYAAKLSAAILFLLDSVIGTASLLSALLCCVTVPARDIFMGPIDHQRLNLWAKQIVRLEAAAEREALAQPMQVEET